MARVKLNDTKLREALERHLAVAVEKAALGLVGHIRTKIGISARTETPSSRRARINSRKRAGLKARSHIYEPSKPGEPPRKRTGTLQKSIAHEVKREGDQVIARVGTKVPYGKHLEYGTRRMQPRPFLRPSLTEYGKTFHSVVMVEMRRKLSRG